MQDVKPQQQQREQQIPQRPQEATAIPVASAAAHLPELPVEADVDWQETAGRQVDASVEGGIDEEETAGWQAALGADEVQALLAGAGVGAGAGESVSQGRRRMGGGGKASEGEGGRKGGEGVEGEGVEGEGKPLGIEGGEEGGEAGGERWDVPLVPDMPGVLSMGDVMGGVEQMAASTWSGAKEVSEVVCQGGERGGVLRR
ncbi:unnamed protein product [Closterium sp. Yama58-4]|nr:unnamed protein product [Closterium sp. Yama58-4]